MATLEKVMIENGFFFLQKLSKMVSAIHMVLDIAQPTDVNNFF